MKILVVDDERMALELLKEELTELKPQAEVICFQFSEDALVYMQTAKCDIAILDIEMPQINGIMLAKKLKAYYPDINIIFATAYREYGLEAMQMHASGYLLKPVKREQLKKELENLRFPVNEPKADIYEVTFGAFELLVHGEPVHFGRSKSKEMLAYLIDCHGASVTKKEIAAILFENQEYTRANQDYMNKIVRELEKNLKEVGADRIFVKRHNNYAIKTSEFSCDLYEYESGKPGAINRFHGEYMRQYSWAEETLGTLMNPEENVAVHRDEFGSNML